MSGIPASSGRNRPDTKPSRCLEKSRTLSISFRHGSCSFVSSWHVPRFIRWFSELGLNDVPLVGGKNASLGELYCALTPHGIMVPNGFAITAAGYRYVLQAEGIDHAIRAILADLDTHDITNLAERGREVRELILNASFPNDFQDEILEAYATLCNEHDHTSDVSDVAVRSSATAEDLPDASFAGQQDSFLNIRGDCALLDACKRCMASLFTDRAISYRVDKAFDHFIVALSICVQRMVRADLGSAGVLFTLDTESGFRNAVLHQQCFTALVKALFKGEWIRTNF